MNIDEGFVNCGENLASLKVGKTSEECPLFGESAEALEAGREEINYDRGGRRRRGLGRNHFD